MSARSKSSVLFCALAAPVLASALAACESAPPHPSNDNWGAAQRLASSAGGGVSGTTLGATSQPGEGDPAYSVWYRWVAPTTGVTTFTTTGGLGSEIDAFTGATYASLDPASSSFDEGETQLRVTAGKSYSIRLASDLGTAFTMKWTTLAPPSNDNRQTPTTLTGAAGSVVGDTTAARRQPSDPAIEGTTYPTTVWYRWTAPANGWYEFDTNGSPVSTALGAYTDDGALTPLDVSSGDCGTADLFDTTATSIGFQAQSGHSYLLMAAGVDDNSGFSVGDDGGIDPSAIGGPLQLNWRQALNAPVASGNDAFAAATPISGTQGSLEGSTIGATAEPGEPAHTGSPAKSSVWFSWTPPATGDYILNAVPTGTDACPAGLAVYSGTALTHLSRVPISDNQLPLAQLADSTDGDGAIVSDEELSIASIRVHLTKGVTYHVAADRVGQPSTFTLQWDIPQAKPTLRSVTPGNSSIGVIWSPPAPTAGSTRSGYFVAAIPVKPDDSDDTDGIQPVILPVTSAFTTIHGLKNGTAYRIIIAAVNGSGLGDLTFSGPVTPHK